MSEAVCLECGQVSPRTMPARFPHICEECLFPPLPVERRPEAVMPLPPFSVLLEELHRAVKRQKPFWDPKQIRGWDE